jgi:23S rRNA (uracil1939-C5)-methyltransferase
MKCSHFPSCGGCATFGHDYTAEAEGRRLGFEEGLQSISQNGELPPVTWLAPPPKKAPQGFRNHLLWPLRRKEGGGLTSGLYKRGSHDLVPIENCATQHPLLVPLAHEILGILSKSKLPAYDEETGQGVLRALSLRCFPSTGDCMVTLVTKGGLFEQGRALSKKIQEIPLPRLANKSYRITGIMRSINDESGNRLLGKRFVPLLGRDWILDESSGLRFQVSAGSFYQSNIRARTLLFEPLFAQLGELRGKSVVDAFAGVGTFGLRALKAGAKSLVLIESNPSATRDAKQNLSRNKLEAEVRSNSFAEGVQGLPSPDLLLLDPDRAGLQDEGKAAIANLLPHQICYVSCFVKSLAPDLEALRSLGYSLEQLFVTDLFPRTTHIEGVALLRRIPPGDR